MPPLPFVIVARQRVDGFGGAGSAQDSGRSDPCVLRGARREHQREIAVQPPLDRSARLMATSNGSTAALSDLGRTITLRASRGAVRAGKGGTLQKDVAALGSSRDAPHPSTPGRMKASRSAAPPVSAARPARPNGMIAPRPGTRRIGVFGPAPDCSWARAALCE